METTIMGFIRFRVSGSGFRLTTAFQCGSVLQGLETDKSAKMFLYVSLKHMLALISDCSRTYFGAWSEPNPHPTRAHT